MACRFPGNACLELGTRISNEWERKKFGVEDLCDPLEKGGRAEREAQQVVRCGVGDETGEMGSKELRER